MPGTLLKYPSPPPITIYSRTNVKRVFFISQSSRQERAIRSTERKEPADPPKGKSRKIRRKERAGRAPEGKMSPQTECLNTLTFSDKILIRGNLHDPEAVNNFG